MRTHFRAEQLANPSLAEAEKMMQVAVLLPSSAFVGWLLGAGLDKLFHQTWITLVGILFGGISGIVYVVRMVITAGAKKGAGTGPNSDNSGPGTGAGK